MSLRLLLNGRFLNRPVTGVERLALELARALRGLLSAAGEADLAVAVPRGTPRDRHGEALGVPLPQFRTIGRLPGHPWEQAELAHAEPDAWLLDFCNTGPVARRRQVLVICDAQIALHPESYSLPFRWWTRAMMTLASRRAAVVFTISHFSREQLERFGIVPRGKLRVLRLGVDHLNRVTPDETVLARHRLDRPYLLAIGSLAPHKNLALLLDAFVAADLAGMDLVIAGGGNSRVFQDAGLRTAANIRLLGRVTDGELKALYAGAHAFACPSLSEGFGFTPLEAMTMGCPVVATTGGAVPEVCGDAAIYADPHDRAAWTEALRRIASEPALRAQLAERAGARARLFTWRETARQVVEALAEHDTAAAPVLAAPNAA